MLVLHYHYYYYHYYYYYSTLYYKFTYNGKKRLQKQRTLKLLKKITKMTRLSLQNKLSLSLSRRKNDIGNKKKKRKKERNATRLDRGSIRWKRKTCKAIQTRLSGLYGRLAPKESVNSVQMPFRKVRSLGSDWLAVSYTCILWIDLLFICCLRYTYIVRVSSLVLQSQFNVVPGYNKAKIYLLMKLWRSRL